MRGRDPGDSPQITLDQRDTGTLHCYVRPRAHGDSDLRQRQVMWLEPSEALAGHLGWEELLVVGDA